MQRGISAAWEAVVEAATEVEVVASPAITTALLIVAVVVVVDATQVTVVHCGPLLLLRIFRFFGIRS